MSSKDKVICVRLDTKTNSMLDKLLKTAKKGSPEINKSTLVRSMIRTYFANTK